MEPMNLFVHMHKSGGSSLCKILLGAAGLKPTSNEENENCNTIHSDAAAFAAVQWVKGPHVQICCARPSPGRSCIGALRDARAAAVSAKQPRINAKSQPSDILLRALGHEVLKIEPGFTAGPLNLASFCPLHFNYITILRDPLARLRSHLCYSSVWNLGKRPWITSESRDKKVVWWASQLFGSGKASQEMSRLSTFPTTRAAVDNYYVRVLAGAFPVAGQKILPVGESELATAKHVLRQFRAVMLLERLDEDLVQLGPPLLPSVPRMVHLDARSRRSTSKGSTASRLKFMARPCTYQSVENRTNLSAAMINANELDVRLYEFARELANNLTIKAHLRGQRGQPHAVQ
jgi:hypothetical protein